jgi:hypothetical protein
VWSALNYFTTGSTGRGFIGTVLNLSYLKGVPFIVSPSTSELSHIEYSSAEIFRESFRVQEQNKGEICIKGSIFTSRLKTRAYNVHRRH